MSPRLIGTISPVVNLHGQQSRPVDIRPLQVVWLLVHHVHQLIATASFRHYWHCARAIMLFAIYTCRLGVEEGSQFKGLISQQEKFSMVKIESCGGLLK